MQLQPTLLPPGPPPSPVPYNVKQWKLVSLRETPVTDRVFDTPERVAEFHRAVIQTDSHYCPDVESFYVLHLNTRRRITGYNLASTGTLDTLLVDHRIVFRAALVANCAAIVLMHNHPSGDPTPSEADIKVTRDLCRAGQLLKIEVMDHVIMGKATPERSKDFVSLRELGYWAV